MKQMLLILFIIAFVSAVYAQDDNKLNSNASLHEESKSNSANIEDQLLWLPADFAGTSTPDADEAIILNEKGVRLALEKHYGEAVTLFQKAMALEPKSASINYNLASALNYAERFDEAIREFNRLIEIKPDFGKAHL